MGKKELKFFPSLNKNQTANICLIKSNLSYLNKGGKAEDMLLYV